MSLTLVFAEPTWKFIMVRRIIFAKDKRVIHTISGMSGWELLKCLQQMLATHICIVGQSSLEAP